MSKLTPEERYLQKRTKYLNSPKATANTQRERVRQAHQSYSDFVHSLTPKESKVHLKHLNKEINDHRDDPDVIAFRKKMKEDLTTPPEAYNIVYGPII